jgi:hypothetical protein
MTFNGKPLSMEEYKSERERIVGWRERCFTLGHCRKLLYKFNTSLYGVAMAFLKI